MPDTDLHQIVLENSKEFLEELETVERKRKLALNDLTCSFRRIDDIINSISDHQKRLKELQTCFREVQTDIGTSTDDIGRVLELCEQKVNELRLMKRKSGSFMLRLLLGHVNVRVWNDRDRMDLKTEYNHFKFQCSIVQAVLPVFHILFGFTWVAIQWHDLALVYINLSLAVRENILFMNGSRIEDWWVMHHYLSMFGCLLHVLVVRTAWESYQELFELTNYCFLFFGVVSIIVNYAQKKRHYVRVSLGRATEMDVCGETLSEARGFKWLVPLLVVTYIVQFIMGLYVLYFQFHNVSDDRLIMSLVAFEVICGGFTWLALAIGNAVTLKGVVARKVAHLAESESSKREHAD